MPMNKRGPLSHWNLEGLARRVGLTPRNLVALSQGREDEYREKVIRTGTGKERKERRLQIPSRSLKMVQKRILRGIFDTLVPHESTACVKSRGLHWAYRRHAGHPALLRLDIKDFFPSVTELSVVEGLTRLGACDVIAKVLNDLVMLPSGLPQGAPTSVAVADIVLFPIDIRLGGLATKHGLTYTRYIDDLTVSGGQRVVRYQKVAHKIVTELSWELNAKGGVVGHGQRHTLLGAVVNYKPNICGEYYEDVRSYLRLIARGRKLPPMSVFNKLRSRVEWICSVNPERNRVLRPLLEAAVEHMANAGHALAPARR